MAHEHIRHDGLHERRSERKPRFRIELADFGDHVGKVFVADAANLAKRCQVSFGQEIEMRHQRLHGRVEAVPLLELNRKAFGQTARADAERLEALQDYEHGFYFGWRRSEFLRDLRQIFGEISGLVHEIN